MRRERASVPEARRLVRASTRAAIAGGAILAGLVGVAAIGAVRVRQARTRPDPERGQPLADRPGPEHRMRSFDGTELAVNVVGREGPEVSTLVFAHGFGLDMTAWHYQWKHFSKEYRCVLYDQRGHGRSAPALHGDYSIAALGRDLKMVIDAETGHGPVVVVGHSMGGMSILSLASQYPQEIGRRVRAVVLADTAASDISTDVLGGLATKVGTIVIPFAR